MNCWLHPKAGGHTSDLVRKGDLHHVTEKGAWIICMYPEGIDPLIRPTCILSIPYILNVFKFSF